MSFTKVPRLLQGHKPEMPEWMRFAFEASRLRLADEVPDFELSALSDQELMRQIGRECDVVDSSSNG